MNDNLTYLQAKQLCKSGMKISHAYFSRGEYVYLDENGDFRDEANNYLMWNEFWNIRKHWADGWYEKILRNE